MLLKQFSIGNTARVAKSSIDMAYGSMLILLLGAQGAPLGVVLLVA